MFLGSNRYVKTPLIVVTLPFGALFNKTATCLGELQKDASESKVHLTEYSQPLCTAIQVALVDLLETFEIRPTAIIGHSSGEIAAA